MHKEVQNFVLLLPKIKKKKLIFKDMTISNKPNKILTTYISIESGRQSSFIFSNKKIK